MIYTVNTIILPDKLAQVESDWTKFPCHIQSGANFSKKIPIWINAAAAIVKTN